jgi:hypothetical protein
MENMQDKKAMRQAALDMLTKLKDLDLSKAKMVSVSVVMAGEGMPKKGMPSKMKMSDDSMMEDEEDYGEEESSGEYCSGCGMKKSECEC